MLLSRIDVSDIDVLKLVLDNRFALPEDYYFLDKKMDRLDTLDAVNAQILLALNGRVVVEDQRDLVKAIGSQEKYQLFHDEIDKVAAERLKSLIPTIADKSEVSTKECRKILKSLR